MSPTPCPNGHASTATDYCDVCGAPMPAGSGTSSASGSATPGAGPSTGPVTAPAPLPPAEKSCVSCGTPNAPEALFCESCGYDFTTGAMPRPLDPPSSLDLSQPATAAAPGPTAAQAPVAPAVPLEWVAEVWVDPDWYSEQDSDEPCPSPGLPLVVPLTVRSVLVGRTSSSRNIHPQVDCSTDVGVSRRQSQLSTDGSRWWVEDLQSSNGTYVGPASGPLPTVPVPPSQRQELAEDDRVYVGAWTRIVVRRATPEEQSA